MRSVDLPFLAFVDLPVEVADRVRNVDVQVLGNLGYYLLRLRLQRLEFLLRKRRDRRRLLFLDASAVDLHFPVPLLDVLSQLRVVELLQSVDLAEQSLEQAVGLDELKKGFHSTLVTMESMPLVGA